MTHESLVALHDHWSTYFALPGLHLTRHLRGRSGVDGAHYDQGLQFRRASWEWSNDQKREWTLHRLRYIVRYAYASTRYYREVFDQAGFDPRSDFTFDDFSRLPVLERATVQERRDDLRSSNVPAREAIWNATGGSSGKPVEIFMGPAERGWRQSGEDFAMQSLRVRSGVRSALLWGHHLDAVTRDGVKDRLLNFIANRRWYDCLRLSEQKLWDYDRDMRAYRPRLLVAYASALHALAQAIRDAGLPPPTYPTRRIVTGAEKLFTEQRTLIESVFRVPLHERYGSRDVGGIGIQYAPQETLGFRLDWALVMLEPAKQSPEADILVTKLHGDAMPVIRYRTDDVARFGEDAKPGHPTFELEEVLGRRANRIFRHDGSWVHGIHFPHLMKDFPVRDFQIAQSEDYSVTVSVVPRPGAPIDLLDGIRRNVEANLEGVPVTVRIIDDIPRTRANKWQPVVSAVRRER